MLTRELSLFTMSLTLDDSVSFLTLKRTMCSTVLVDDDDILKEEDRVLEEGGYCE